MKKIILFLAAALLCVPALMAQNSELGSEANAVLQEGHSEAEKILNESEGAVSEILSENQSEVELKLKEFEEGKIPAKKKTKWAKRVDDEGNTVEISDEEALAEFEEGKSGYSGSFVASDNRMYLPHRTFELGFDLGMGISNNYFNATDMLVKDLVLDFTKVSEEMPEYGWKSDSYLAMNFFANLNLKNGVHVGLANGFESTGNMGLSKELFDFLGNGNKLNEKISFDAEGYGDLFYYMNVGVGFEIYGFYLEVVPALFMPVIHAEVTNCKSSFLNSSDGDLHARVQSDINLYSCFDMEPFFDSDGEVDTDKIVESLKEGWGFDFTSSLSKKILSTLDVSAYSRIPIVPGKLNYKAAMTMKGIFDADELTKVFEDDGLTKDFSVGDKTFTNETFNVNRPFRMGGEAAWRPFGKWFTVGGLLGFGVRSPFTSDAKGYVEYKLSTNVDLYAGKKWNILGLRLHTAYLHEVFEHYAGFMFNLKAFEIESGISAQGGDFAKSFKGTGTGVYLMMSLGW